MSGQVPTERWLPIPGFEGLYEVSDLGRVRTLPRHHVPATVVHKGCPHPRSGHIMIRLRKDGRCHPTEAHRLVARAFLGPRPRGKEVRHLNGVPSDNRLANLAYGTRVENANDSVRLGVHYQTRKTHCPKNHPYDESNTRWGRGKRYCRACDRDRIETRSLARRQARAARPEPS